ncbi:MAG: hypothetical protein AAGA20_23810 [Planctomycetota bacterium]
MSWRLGSSPRQALLALALVLLGTPIASAQRLLVPHDRPHALVALVDARAGALVDAAWLDVQSTAEPAPGSNALTCAERVGGEVWVGGALHVWRYDVATRAFLRSFTLQSPVRSIERQSERVLVTTPDYLQVFGFDGTPRARLDVAGAGDTLELRDGSMLVAIRDESRIDRYTLDGRKLCAFAGPTIPSTLGVLSNPLQLALRGNGNVLVCGDVRVYEFTPQGEFIAEYDVGPFEGGVAETASGRLFVPLGDGIALHDSVSGATTRVGAPDFGQGRATSLLDSGLPTVVPIGSSLSEVTCRGARNSTGMAARVGVVGSVDVSDRLLSVFGERLPPGAATFLLYGPDIARLARAGGTLCLDPATTSVARLVTVANASGQVLVPLVRGSSAAVVFPAGSRWNLQLLYRDRSAIKLSDAIRITFAQ